MKNFFYFFIMITYFSFAQQRKNTPQYQLVKYSIDTLSINTEHSDFGTSYLNPEEVIFSSPKKNTFFTRKWRDNEQPYLELYKGSVNNKGEVVNVAKYSKELNSRYHEAELAITKSGKEVYFTSNNHINGKGIKSSDGFNNLQLYKADVKEGIYTNIRLLPFNSKEFSTGHPILTDNDNTLYFISDRPGGYGQTDIYKVAILSNDQYGDVVNLGSKINSPSKEMFPFIDTDDVMYFSSDREGGKGALDVYAVALNTFDSEVFLMREPINSESDDFAFVLGQGRYGFLSSNREGGKGDDDVYKLVFDCLQRLKGLVYDESTKAGLGDTQVYIYSNNNILLDSVFTDASGTFSTAFPVYCGSNYSIKASKLNYSSDSLYLSTPNQKNYVNTVSLALATKCSQSLVGSVYNKKTGKGLSGATVYIYSGENTLLDSLYTDATGQFKAITPISCNADYVVKASKPNYSTARKRFTSSGINNFTNKVFLSLESEFTTNPQGKIIIDIEPIYFDYDKSNIRPDAAKILDKVVSVMNKYPNMIVEGGSHTDSRGSDNYNQKLSARRAKSTVDYIISKGISSDRISSKGYGETQLTNKCSNGVRCSKQAHQDNRRTEFVIIKQ